MCIHILSFNVIRTINENLTKNINKRRRCQVSYDNQRKSEAENEFFRDETAEI
jgi:hypothetical protein